MSDQSRQPLGKYTDETGTSWQFFVGVAIVVLAVGYIVTSSMTNTTHFYEVAEVTDAADLVGTTMRLRGYVVEGSHRVRNGTLDQHLFVLTTEQQVMTVLFQGALPDQFEDGAEVIATGVLRDRETFEADTVTAQCPSRYENEAPTAPGNDNGESGGGYGAAAEPVRQTAQNQ